MGSCVLFRHARTTAMGTASVSLMVLPNAASVTWDLAVSTAAAQCALQTARATVLAVPITGACAKQDGPETTAPSPSARPPQIVVAVAYVSTGPVSVVALGKAMRVKWLLARMTARATACAPRRESAYVVRASVVVTARSLPARKHAAGMDAASATAGELREMARLRRHALLRPLIRPCPSLSKASRVLRGVPP